MGLSTVSPSEDSNALDLPRSYHRLTPPACCSLPSTVHEALDAMEMACSPQLGRLFNSKFHHSLTDCVLLSELLYFSESPAFHW